MKKLSGLLGNSLAGIFGIAYLGLSFVQFFAILAGIQDWWGVHWLFSGLIAMFIAPIPIIGTITGYMGAVKGWHMDELYAALLFFTIPALYIVALLIAAAFDDASRYLTRNKRRAETKARLEAAINNKANNEAE